MTEQKGRSEDLFARSEVKRARRTGLFGLPAGQKGHREHLFSETEAKRGRTTAFRESAAVPGWRSAAFPEGWPTGLEQRKGFTSRRREGTTRLELLPLLLLSS